MKIFCSSQKKSAVSNKLFINKQNVSCAKAGTRAIQNETRFFYTNEMNLKLRVELRSIV
ncbi:MAG TPA: hypothetical protein VF610_09100 [Segetibacter sp.]